MTTEERRKRARIKRRKQVAKRKMVLLLAAVIIITIGSVVFGSIFSSAKNSTETPAKQYEYYKSVVIEHGDSLWSIAKEYSVDTDMTQKEYVNELKRLNALTSETIHAGQNLVVVYYDTELK